MIALHKLRDLLLLLIPYTYEELVKLFSPTTLTEYEYVRKFEGRMKKKVKFLEDLLKEIL